MYTPPGPGWGPALALAVACGGPAALAPPRTAPAPSPPADDAPYVLLSPEDQLLRVSVTLRGTRPTADERALVAADPAALADLADAWVHDPRFGDIVRDVWSEALLVRADVLDGLPAVGATRSTTIGELQQGVMEEPLRLIERVVVEGRPFTEVVTADWTMANRALSLAYDLPYDEGGPEWQESRYRDGRPAAGVLSTNGLWFRHQSAGTNFHRGRANLVSRTFLCEDYLEREITVDTSIDPTDPAAVADAVRTIPACASCHQSLDPLAANLWGFVESFGPVLVQRAHDSGCDGDAAPLCYPLALWDAGATDAWSELGLPAPGLAGRSTGGLEGLGQELATDPRFAQCVARRFAAWMSQSSLDAVSFDEVARLQDALGAAAFDARAVVLAFVDSDRFLAAAGGPPDAPPLGLLPVRPEQHERAIVDLTGFTWSAACDACQTDYGAVQLLTNDRFGYRAMAGGIDGFYVTQPTTDLGPTRVLAYERVALEAAGFVVDADFALPATARRLLGLVEADTVDAAAVRAQLAALHERILAETPSALDLDDSAALFAIVAADAGAVAAWKAVVAALLQDDRMLWY